MTRHASCGKADGLGAEARTQLGSGPYSDLCGEVTKTGEFSTYSPYDNTTMPFWKTKQLRQGYWAATVSATVGLGRGAATLTADRCCEQSYCDANFGTILDGLEQHGFAQNTVVLTFGDHGALPAPLDFGWFPSSSFT